MVLKEEIIVTLYTSRGDRYENLSSEKYLKMIRLYLTGLINNHKPLEELNDEANDGEANDRDTERGEWKVQLVMQNNCISSKNFEHTRTSKPVNVFMGSDAKNVIDRLFDTFLQRFQKAIETSIGGGSKFTHESVALLYYYFQKIDIRRAESYIASPDRLVIKGATTTPRNENDNKCFQFAIVIALNYDKILKSILKEIEKIRRSDIDFSSYQRDWQEFEQNNTSVTLNVLFV